MSKRMWGNLSLVLIGVLIGVAIQPVNASLGVAQGTCVTFKETGKNVCGRFLEYWQKNGGLAQQGLPLTNEFTEISELNGQTYMVQYFERAVFEKHPENTAPYDVLLSQLGTFQLKRKYPAGDPSPAQPPVAQTPVAPPAATAAPPSGAPRDTKAFGEYIAKKYNKVGNLTLVFDNIYGNDVAGTHYVSLDVDLNTDLALDDVGRPAAEAWGNAVLAEAKAVWPNEPFSISLEWATYSQSICTGDCVRDCYYQADNYTRGQGWYTVYTFVKVRHDKPVLVCHYIK